MALILVCLNAAVCSVCTGLGSLAFYALMLMLIKKTDEC